jgi:hypothetical protein
MHLRYLGWYRGQAYDLLQRIVADLEAGRPLDAYDVPPERLPLR